MASGPRVVVVGSVNLDLVVRVERLPQPGETVGGGTFARVPGGKGANQAVACARLGADVTLVAAVGRDPHAEEALAGLRGAGVALELVETDEPTGVALIQVDAAGRRRSRSRPAPTRRSARSSCRHTTLSCASSRCPTQRCSPRGRSAPASSASTQRPRGRSRWTPTSRSSIGTSSRLSPGVTASLR